MDSPFGSPKPAEDAMTEPSKWTCPKCKADNTPDFTHCRMCGEHNPAAPQQDAACATNAPAP